MFAPFISDAVDKHPTFIFSVIRSRMFAPFISDAKDKHPTFIFSIIRSRMFAPFISDAKDKHPTFIFSVIRSRMFPPFISDAKDKHPTFIFSVIRSRMFAPFISDAKDKHPTFIFSVIRSRMLLPFITDEHPLDFCAVGEKPDHNWCRNYILFLMSKIMHGKRNIRSNSAPKIRHIGGKTDRHWCWYLIPLSNVRNIERVEEHLLDFCSKIKLHRRGNHHGWCRN